MISAGSGPRKQSYPTLLLATEAAFNSARQKGGMSESQAFAFAYDEMERLLRDPSAWVRCAAYVALFKIGHTNGVDLHTGDPFDLEVRAELSSSLAELQASGAMESVSFGDLGGFVQDAADVTTEYLR